MALLKTTGGLFKGGLNAPNAKGNVYVGLDFGTTYSKISFRVLREGARDLTQGSDIYTISPSDCKNFIFDSEYYPSCLWFNCDTNQLHFLPSNGLNEVKYFKYALFSSALKTNLNKTGRALKLKNGVSSLCAVFYLAALIRRIKTFVSGHLVARNFKELAWYINMGVPLNQFKEGLESIYEEVLQIAWILHESLPDKVDITQLDQAYSRVKGDLRLKWNNNLHTVPELYAEILLFLRNTAIVDGLYTVVDIGGGTVDIAVFLKEIDKNNNPKIRCISQVVSPIGNEILRKQKSIEKIVDEMNFAYGGALIEAYKKHRFTINNLRNKGIKHQIFFLGGGRDVPFYKNRVENMAQIQENAVHIPKRMERDILEFLRRQTIVKKLKLKTLDHRLLISQMLALPYNDVPRLDGVSWKKM